ncbi:YueH family protein [Rossellomorea vietnamensis]|uniref:YueH family protein n=1 Tax=Rossellomorea vietnamensis TaxID=218284 RepID=UPI001E5DA305|nr:YueH family protein [Rossellomorea vietnamensis]MCC5804598.1 YueH family protein [Rossellomorea vietnamensis]
MKIRKNFLEGLEQKVYIYENKKEEFFLIAVPSIEWSYSFLYGDEEFQSKLLHSLMERIPKETAETLSSRIVQWTTEM